MCARFEQHFTAMQEWQGLVISWPQQLPIRFDIHPGDTAMTLSEQGWCERKWSLLPKWSKSSQLKFSTFNARSEGISAKPTFREPWRRGQRCVVPASAYFEWSPVGSGKQCHRIAATTPLFMAGLWELWQRGSERVDSFTILTSAAPSSMTWLHPRIPLLIASADLDQWLTGSVEEAGRLMAKEGAPLTAIPVTRPDSGGQQRSLFDDE